MKVYFCYFNKKVEKILPGIPIIATAEIKYRDRATGIIVLSHELEILEGKSVVHETHELLAFSERSAVRKALSQSIDKGRTLINELEAEGKKQIYLSNYLKELPSEEGLAGHTDQPPI